MRWEELTSPEIGALDKEHTVVVLPIGAVEQHGNHMPVGTDTMLAHAICLAVSEKQPDVLVMPPPWYGFSAHHMKFPGTVTLQIETLLALCEDIVASVIGSGFRRIVVVNGHGGNSGAIDVLAAKLGHKHYGSARIATLTYFSLAREAIAKLRKSRSGGMGHACEFETAMMMAVNPALVQMDRAVVTYPDPNSAYLDTDLIGSQAVRVYHDFSDLSPSGTFGDPSFATAEAGAQFFEVSVEALSGFIEDFRSWPIPGRML